MVTQMGKETNTTSSTDPTWNKVRKRALGNEILRRSFIGMDYLDMFLSLRQGMGRVDSHGCGIHCQLFRSSTVEVIEDHRMKYSPKATYHHIENTVKQASIIKKTYIHHTTM